MPVTNRLFKTLKNEKIPSLQINKTDSDVESSLQTLRLGSSKSKD